MFANALSQPAILAVAFSGSQAVVQNMGRNTPFNPGLTIRTRGSALEPLLAHMAGAA